MRLEVEAAASQELVALLREQLDITPDDVYAVPGPLDLRVLIGLDGAAGLRRAARSAAAAGQHRSPNEEHRDVFAVLDERDILLHHPYEAYDPVVALLDAGRRRPRRAGDQADAVPHEPGSPIIASLQRAAENNKQVTVLVELTARFDEERNIRWARALEEAGAHVIYGVRGYKMHAKICQIVRRTPYGLRRYVHLGTGNYNERTARVYTDFGADDRRRSHSPRTRARSSAR